MIIMQLKGLLTVLIKGTMHSEFKAGHWMNDTFAAYVNSCSTLTLETVKIDLILERKFLSILSDLY